MSHHTITKEELNAYLSSKVWDMAASSVGNGSQKFLYVSNDGAYRVTDQGTECYAGSDMDAAIKAYNDAQ